MGLAEIRSAVVAKLETIGGLRVYPEPPATVAEFPAVIIASGGISAKYDQTLQGGGVRYSLDLLLLVDSGDAAESWDKLESYVGASGAASVKAALDGNLNGAAHWARVLAAAKVGEVGYRKGSYWGASFRLEVFADG